MKFGKKILCITMRIKDYIFFWKLNCRKSNRETLTPTAGFTYLSIPLWLHFLLHFNLLFKPFESFAVNDRNPVLVKRQYLQRVEPHECAVVHRSHLHRKTTNLMSCIVFFLIYKTGKQACCFQCNEFKWQRNCRQSNCSKLEENVTMHMIVKKACFYISCPLTIQCYEVRGC